MTKIQSIAASGVAAGEARLAASARNVANALTPGYRPVVASSSEVASGGVSVTVSRASDPVGEARADRALLAGASPAASGTDLVAEVVEQARAAALTKANLATLRTADETLEALLQLKR